MILSVAPNVGSFILTYYSWRKIFIFLIIYFCIILLSTFFLKNTNQISGYKRKSAKQYFQLYVNLLLNRKFMLFSLFISLTWMGISALATVSPFLFQNIIGFSIKEHGILFFYIGSMMICGGVINLILLKYFTSIQILPIGIVTTLLSSVSLIIVYYFDISNSMFLMAYLLFFLGVPIILSNSFSLTCSLTNKERGVVNAFLLFIQLSAAWISSFVFALIPSIILPLAFLLLIIVCVHTKLILVALSREWFKNY